MTPQQDALERFGASTTPLDSTIANAIAEGEARFAEGEKRARQAARKWAHGEDDGQPSTLYKKVLEAASSGQRRLPTAVDKYQAEVAAELGLKVRVDELGLFWVTW